MKAKTKYFILFIALGIFFTISVKISYHKKSVLSNLQKFTIDLKISQLEKLYASTASDKWEPIREIAKFIQEISLAIDDLLMTFQNAGIFNHTGTFTFNDGTFKYKLVMNDPQTINLSHLGFSGILFKK